MREISLVYLLNLAWRRIWILIAALAVSAGLAFGFCKFVASPKYAAKASILVTNGGTMIGQGNSSASGDSKTVANNDIVASINIVTTVVDVLKTNDIYKKLANTVDNGADYNTLIANSKVEARGEKTMFIDVTFTAPTEKEALALTNGFVELVPDYISDSIPNSYTKYYVADKATQTYPTTAKTTAIVALLGAVLAFGAVLLFDMLDRGIKGESDYSARFNIPLLGTVPDFGAAGESGSYISSRGGASK